MKAPNTDNYTLGKGIVYFDELISGVYQGERDLGNAPEFTFSIDIETLEHFSSRGGLRAKDKKIITQVTPALAFTLDEVNEDNVGLLTLADVEAVVQAIADGLSKTITAETLDRFYELDARSVGVWKIGFKNGTAEFNVGAELTGATGVANILQVVLETGTWAGSDAAGYMMIEVTTAGFIADETLADDGGTPGAGDAVAAEFFDATDLCCGDGTGTTFYTKTTDYIVHSATGRVQFVSGGALTDGDDVTVEYANAAAEYNKVKTIAKTEIEGRLRFVSDNPVGNNMELQIWRVSLTPAGDTAMIGDDWSTLAFEGEVLKDETGHPSSPYMNIIM